MTSARITEGLSAAGLFAGPWFTLVYVVEGARRKDYSALRHPVSSLALGEHGWRQAVNFLSTGALMVAYGVGVQRSESGARWLPRLIGSVGVGLLGAGVFATDPLSGYPPGTLAVPARPTPKGVLHVLFSALVFLGLPAAFIVDARTADRGWARYSKATCLGFAGTFLVARAGFGQAPRLVGVAGLFQRLALSIGFAWVSARALRSLRLS